MKSYIARKLIIYTVLFSSAITLIITSVQLYTEFQYDVSDINKRLEQIKTSYQESITQSVWVSDRQQLQIILDGITELPDIVYAKVSSEDSDDIISGSNTEEENISLKIDLHYLYNAQNIHIGNLIVVASLSDVYHRLLNRLWIILLSNALKTALVVLFIYFIFSHLVTRHLSRISEFIERHNALSRNKKLVLERETKQHDELDTVVDSINDMHARLEQQIYEINKQKKYLSQTLNSIGDAVITTDKDGNVTRLNPIAEKLTGWTSSEAQTQPLKTIFPIVDASTREPIASPVDKVLSTGETVHLSNHTTLIARDGNEYQIADSAAPILDKEKILGMVLVFNDVTKQYQMREALYESEQRLRQLAENLNEVFWLGSVDWNEIIYISPAYERCWGFSAAELYKKPRRWIDSVHPDDKERVLKDISEYTEGTTEHIDFKEFRLQKPDGEILWIKARAYPVYNKEGKVIRIAGVAEDITRRKHDEQELQFSNEKFSTVFQSSPAGILITDIGSGLILDANKTVEKILGYSAEETINSSTIALNIWKNINDRNRVMTQLPEKKHIHEDKIEINHKSGKTIILSIDFALINISNKDLVISSFIDITKRIQQEEQLRRSQKMDALGKLTGGIAHDYNNMLGVMLGYSELLKDMLDGQPKLQAYVDKIAHAGERGAKLTKKLLAFSKGKSSDVEKFNVNTLLQDEQHMLEKTLTARISLKLKLADNLWPVCLDESELEDAILNISINAMHAIENHGLLTIETDNEHISTAEAEGLDLTAGDYIRLSISDTGCGMDHATKEKIFDPFYTTKGEKGTGLGLSQVYGFITRCCGAIKVDSTLGQGTRFTLYLPRYQGEDSHKYRSRIKNSSELKGQESILVVDDEPALLDLTCEILKQQEYHVFSADNGNAALHIIENEHIDLLFSDIIMPDMNGYTLAAIVQEKYPDIKIQLASGFSDSFSQQQIDENLAKNILQKPFDSQTLLKKIRALLQ